MNVNSDHVAGSPRASSDAPGALVALLHRRRIFIADRQKSAIKIRPTIARRAERAPRELPPSPRRSPIKSRDF
jgi:hypothetical protein